MMPGKLKRIKSRLRQRLKWWRLHHFIIAFGLIAVVVWYIAFRPTTEKIESGANAEPAISTFAMLVEQGNPDQIFRYLDSMESDSNANMVVQIKSLDQKIELAERVLEIGNESSQLSRARLVQISSAYDRELLLDDNELSTETSRAQLKNYAELALKTDDGETRRAGQTALAFLEFLRLRTAKSADRDIHLTNIKSQYEEMKKNFPGDPVVYKSLLGLSNWARKDSATEELSFKLIEIFIEMYSGNEDQQVKRFLVEARRELKRHELNLPSNARTAQVQSKAEGVHRENANRLIRKFANRKTGFAPEDYLKFVNHLMALMQIGSEDSAREILALGKPYFLESQDIPELTRNRLEEVEQILSHYGMEVALPNLQDQSQSMLSLVMLVDPATIEKSLYQIQRYDELTQKLVQSQELEGIIACLRDDQSVNTNKNIELLRAKFPNWKIIRLADSESRQFSKQLPISWLPTSILLDKDDRFIALNPPVELLGKLVLEQLQN